MSRLSLFKSTKSSKSSTSSADTASLRSSMTGDSSQVSYVQIPGLAPAQRQTSHKPSSKQGSIPGYAEMLDDDNLAWGKSKKTSRR